MNFGRSRRHDDSVRSSARRHRRDDELAKRENRWTTALIHLYIAIYRYLYIFMEVMMHAHTLNVYIIIIDLVFR